MLHFVMPSDKMEPLWVDEFFRPQSEALRACGFQSTLVHDAIFDEGGMMAGIPDGAVVVYRGWMVRPEQYSRLEQAVQRSGGAMLTSAANYVLTHHLPNWYPYLREFTAETVFVETSDELFLALERLNWGSYFLKDYVKSLKVEGGSIVRSNADAERWIREMAYYRDELEGGISIRRVESFLPDSECRFFILDKVAYAPDERAVPEPVIQAATRIDCPFFTVDAAEAPDGKCRIVELGDGQVSDLVGWSLDRFVKIWPRVRIWPV